MAKTKAKIPKERKKLRRLGTIIKKELLRTANTTYKDRFHEIVAPFESNIKMVATVDKSSSTYVVNIHGSKGDTATVNAAGDSVSSHDLFMWLDGGFERYTRMPDDFGNESFASSTDTVHRDYDREGIYFSDEPPIDVPAREWTRLVAEELKGTLSKNVGNVVKSHLKKR